MIVGVKVFVGVGVIVGVEVFVGVFEGVNVAVGVLVLLGVKVSVGVSVSVGVEVAVFEAVGVVVFVGVLVGVCVAVVVAVGVSVIVGVSEGVKVNVDVKVLVGGLGVADSPGGGGGGGLMNFDIRNFSTTPFCEETRWVIFQAVLAESPNKLSNCRKGVMKGWLKSTVTTTSSPGSPASSMEWLVGFPSESFVRQSLYVCVPINPMRL